MLCCVRLITNPLYCSIGKGLRPLELDLVGLHRFEVGYIVEGFLDLFGCVPKLRPSDRVAVSDVLVEEILTDSVFDVGDVYRL